jgi:dihydropteroate synthase
VPVVERLAAKTNALLSIDTSKAVVARACLSAGAHIVNDVTGLAGDPEMPAAVRDLAAGAIVMHMQGTPQTMQIAPHYDDVIADISRFFQKRLQDLVNVGIPLERIALDPGIGFGKKSAHNLEIVARLGEFQQFQRPICLGASRKGFIGKGLDRPVEQRLIGSLAVIGYALSRGSAQILRVHDVQETCDLVKMLAAIQSHAKD